ncbi:MAG: family 20 glycosylhydrolase [Candidatus Methylomirabilia bacterium]
MEFLGWMYDIAREQAPRERLLLETLRRSGEAGYTAVGLYVEHRFAYPSAPWAAAPGCLTPEAMRRLSGALGVSGPRVIPFLNTLGHMEGFVRSEGGQWLGEASARGSLQICPSRPECVEFAWSLVSDAMGAFGDGWVHIGGDETRQLGACPACAERVRSIGKAGLYAEYFGRLCRRVLERGRRPCLWGDLLARHPEALSGIPTETVIFDWRYDAGPAETTRIFRQRGFEVVCCPALRSYDSGWCFLDETRQLIDAHAADARRLGALGVLVCAWEFFGFSSLPSVLPLIFAAGRRLARGEGWTAATASEGGPGYAEAAEIVGSRLPAASRFLRPGTWRSLRGQLALQGDPFALWRAWREEACSGAGEAILRDCDRAEALLPEASPLRFPVELHRVAVEWVRLVEGAYRRYAARDVAGCATALARGRALLGRLQPGLERIAAEGGSVGDLHRLDRLLEAIDRVAKRLGELPGDAPWRPAFEALTHEAFTPGDQAGWRTDGAA